MRFSTRGLNSATLSCEGGAKVIKNAISGAKVIKNNKHSPYYMPYYFKNDFLVFVMVWKYEKKILIQHNI